jgi:pimeloyl-ACP methyl ester carboxylesterase
MATLDFKEYSIYYEVYGKGKPLVILNGIMMSTASWQMFISSFSQKNQLILVDMLDQGQSSKLEGLEYTQDIQVEVVKTLIEKLNLKDVALFGISYGGEVAIKFAIKYPHLVERCLLFNTTAYTNNWLKEIGNAWNLASTNAEQYYGTTIPVIYSSEFYESKIKWMSDRKKILLNVFANPVFQRAMVRLTNSANSLDERQNLHKIKCPCLIVGCDEDAITPLSHQKYLHENIKNSSLVIIPGSGHASMYEKQHLFSSLVLGFVHSLIIPDVV